MTKEPLTPTQAKVLDYIRRRHVPPTVRELGEHFGWAPNGVMCHIRSLRRKGYLKNAAHKARGFIVVDDPLLKIRAALANGKADGMRFEWDDELFLIVKER